MGNVSASVSGVGTHGSCEPVDALALAAVHAPEGSLCWGAGALVTSSTEDGAVKSCDTRSRCAIEGGDKVSAGPAGETSMMFGETS